jgi:hypothetical protein
MNKRLLAGIGLAGLAVSPGLAADMPVKAPPPVTAAATGYVEASSGWSSTKDVEAFCFNPLLGGITEAAGCLTTRDHFGGWALGGAGRGNYWFWPNASIQVDAQAEGTSHSTSLFSPSGGTTHFSTHSYLIGTHLNWRDTQQGLLGLFGGVGDAGGASVSSENNRHFVIGGEGQWYRNQLTLYLQVGYDSSVSRLDDSVDRVHAWFVRGTGRWFFEPNLMIEATGLFASGRINYAPTGFLVLADGFPSSLGFSTGLVQAKLEWKPATIPFSLFAKYQWSQTQYDNLNFFLLGDPNTPGTQNSRITDNRFLVGARLYLGESTLQSNDRRGATLDIIDPLGTEVSPLVFGPCQGCSPFPPVIVSDIRLKRDVAKVGRLANGLGLYRYRYLWSDTVYVGVMAQEVALKVPAAVVMGPDGYLRVDYGQLGLRLLTLAQWDATRGHSSPAEVTEISPSDR